MKQRPLLRKCISIIIFCVCLEIFLWLGVPLSNIYYRWQERILHSRQDVYRIMCLGESVTFSGGDASYPRQLEEMLNAKAGKKIFQVNNEGIPGRTTNEIVKVLDDVLQKENPDLVIIMLGVHDIVFGLTVEESWISRLKINVLSKMKLYLLVRDLKAGLRSYIKAKQGREKETDEYIQSLQNEALEKARHLGPGTEEDRQYGLKRRDALLNPHPLMVRNYNEIVEKILHRNIKVFVMQYPSVAVTPLKNMIEQRAKVEFISNERNFQEAYKRYRYEELFVDYVGGVFGHFTPAGAHIVAENLTQPILQFCANDDKCRAIFNSPY